MQKSFYYIKYYLMNKEIPIKQFWHRKSLKQSMSRLSNTIFKIMGLIMASSLSALWWRHRILYTTLYCSVCYITHRHRFEAMRLVIQRDFTPGILLGLNSLRPRNAYMRDQTRHSLVQIMACRLFGAKSLSEPMLDHCKLDPKYSSFHWRNSGHNAIMC